MGNKNTERINQKDNEGNIIIKNYFILKPYQIVATGIQADKNGVFICDAGSKLDKICRIKKAFCISDWIRSLDFVSPETVAVIIEEYEEKIKDRDIMIDDLQEKIKKIEGKKEVAEKKEEVKENKAPSAVENKAEEKETNTTKK